MSIRCGTCHDRHATVAEVRACSANPPAPDAPAQQQPYDPRVPAEPVALATEKQINWVLSLQESKVMPSDVTPMTYAELEVLPRKGNGSISNLIDALLKCDSKPREQVHAKPEVDVPAGRYAVEIDGTLKFYVVDRPTQGRWAGYTFVKVQASDETYPIRQRSLRDQIIANIARDPRGAMLRYGKEIGKCGHCGRTLTNEVSRARGIGPVCAGRMNWLDLVEDSDDDDGPTEAELDAAGVPEWTLS